jgi:hypothetical protein
MLGGTFVVNPAWSALKLPLKTSNIKFPKLKASTADSGFRLMVSQPLFDISGGVYRAESGTRLPYV